MIEKRVPTQHPIIKKTLFYISSKIIKFNLFVRRLLITFLFVCVRIYCNN